MPDNIDLDRIREVYANMLDEEIVQFAQQEGLLITVDAFLLLRAELHKRNIGADVLKTLELEIILQDVLQRKKITEELQTSDLTKAVAFSLLQKEQGTSNKRIYADLVGSGIQEDQADHLVNKLDNWVEILRKDANDEMQAGLAIFILGSILLGIAIRIDEFILAAGIWPPLGIARMVKGALQKRKYEKILETRKMEE
jgi:hypothetical protein